MKKIAFSLVLILTLIFGCIPCVAVAEDSSNNKAVEMEEFTCQFEIPENSDETIKTRLFCYEKETEPGTVVMCADDKVSASELPEPIRGFYIDVWMKPTSTNGVYMPEVVIPYNNLVITQASVTLDFGNGTSAWRNYSHSGTDEYHIYMYYPPVVYSPGTYTYSITAASIYAPHGTSTNGTPWFYYGTDIGSNTPLSLTVR